MQLGVVSDLHGNRVALDAVLDDLPAVDGLICAGDVVGYNPWHADCVRAVRDGGAASDVTGTGNANEDRPASGAVPTVQGNHDRAVASGSSFGFNRLARAGVESAREQLSEGQLAWLADLPTERTTADGRVKLVHGHPDDPDRYTRPEEFSPALLGDEDVLVMGHTHVQHHEVYDEGIVLNPGSVGQPRDGDPQAAYAVLDLDRMAVEERRVEYDVDAVVEEIEAQGLPRELGTRLTRGR